MYFRQGYHKDCLKKSVCEIAKIPLHKNGDDDLVSEILHFVLSPSEHLSFSDAEADNKFFYEAAERYGASGGDCNLLYPDCVNSPLEDVTHLIEEVEDD